MRQKAKWGAALQARASSGGGVLARPKAVLGAWRVYRSLMRAGIADWPHHHHCKKILPLNLAARG